MQKITTLTLIFSGIFTLIGIQTTVSADTASELRTKIDGNREEIQKIESEIQKYEQELVTVQGKKRTLENTIYELDVSRQKTAADIKLTENKINNTENKILTLSEQISEYVEQIQHGSDGLAQALRNMHENESNSLVELFLMKDNLASAWTAVESLRQFQTVVGERVTYLENAKKELEYSVDSKEQEKRVLDAQKDKLASSKYALDINRNEKNSILKATKNTESEYQRILAEKRQAKEEFETELAAYESQLQFVLDKGSLPTGQGVLNWPLANVYITQFFGNTAFAQSGAYNGSGHNGVDFRAVVGTRINAAQSGTITATGNTDAYAGCYSYGKWILIDHHNGISTVYAHLSEISVSAGESVVAGQRIGYSGNTGYSTGPHLHFGTYATTGVRVMKMGEVKARTNCAQARVPIAPTKAYLNPMNYLPYYSN